MTDQVLLDCTFRDGGYYNNWDFPRDVVEDYLKATDLAGIDMVELGFRFLRNTGFKGPCAFTTDDYLRSLPIPSGLGIGVMINASDLYTEMGWKSALERLFPAAATDTPLDLVRIACHYHELEHAMLGAAWLHDRGYRVGLNLMQIPDRTTAEIRQLTRMATEAPIDVLYFADSFGGLTPDATATIVHQLREGWAGPIGVHTHDNLGLALVNVLRASAEGAQWFDSTITGMGRGPGNARTEEIVVELGRIENRLERLIPLLVLIRRYFGPLKTSCGWGTNPYYYLAGKYGIHPSYVQEMVSDARYSEEDVIAVLEQLNASVSKRYDRAVLESARQFYTSAPVGTWSPASEFGGQEILILGPGPGATSHRSAIESYIRHRRPKVLALNVQPSVDEALIDFRIACHPTRLMADAATHLRLTQPLIAPLSMFPDHLKSEMRHKPIRDFGLGVSAEAFDVSDRHCWVPSARVLAYALAVAISARAPRITLAGFDGYPAGDARNDEVENILRTFQAAYPTAELVAVTPTTYRHLTQQSVYGA
jgi:4-hydroxy 2-oxovalerate aldolase